ncbi:MAG: hypothetical protein K6G89_03005 [Clostridia bacterium]|nr:hypothetical protein [Clostridia bacterium]
MTGLKERRLGDEGSFSLEASFVVPAVIIFICLLFTLNFFFVSKLSSYEKYSREAPPNYSDLHRGISAVFDAGGNIYETLFGK